MFKQKSDPAGAARPEPADAVQQARTRARHRLIGAIVLLAVGIIGFPLVFETQPRPVPVDIPIEIPRRDAMPPLAMPSAPPAAVVPAAPASAAVTAEARTVDTTPVASAPSSRSVAAAAASRPPAAASRPGAPRSDGVITESARDAGRDITPSRAASATVAVAASTASRPAVAPAPARADSGDGERARALLEGREPAAAESSRFVVQVGAFADAEAAREARKQVDRLGLKTYTQVAQTASGSRIRVRVGPFTSRADADAALAKAKAAGLSAVVLAL